VEGEETQLDRAILDELGGPLIHLLRNAVDHGIGRPADRVTLGKPRRDWSAQRIERPFDGADPDH
jgi:two-component system chemotaxis sensor kinase CheA